MKESEYIEIAQCLRDADNVSPLSSRSVALPDGGSEDPLFRVARQFSDVHLDTIVNIAWQLHARACKRAAAAQRSPHHIAMCIERFNKGASITDMALAARYSPCLLLKTILPALDPQLWTKTAMNSFIKDPESCPDPRIRAEIESALQHDRYFSPDAEAVRRMIGVQKELELEWQLSGLSIAFENEQELRSRGFAKTPDFHLLVPIAIQGRLVCWIDSKAMFGDPASHRTLVDEQLRIYVNRFGPGLVIYWFGFVDELNYDASDPSKQHPSSDVDILCVSRLPAVFDSLTSVLKDAEEVAADAAAGSTLKLH